MITEFQKNVSFSQGLLERWVELFGAPPQIKEALETLVEGISYYKNNAYSEKEKSFGNSDKLVNSATQITSLLATIQHQQDQIAELTEELQGAQEKIATFENNLNKKSNRGFVEI